MVVVYMGWEDVWNDFLKVVKFGDGIFLLKEVVMVCLDILIEESVFILWCYGDVFVFDNIVV